MVKPEDMTGIFPLSISKLKVHKDCGRKYFYTYIQKLPRKDWDFHKLGKFLHEVCEKFFKGRIEDPTKPLNQQMTESYRSALEVWEPQITKEIKKECYGMIAGYLKKLQQQEKDQCLPNAVGVEDSFNILIDEKVLLNGFIDRIDLESDGTWHVADYKTTKDKKYLKNDFLQLLTYAYVIYLKNPEIKKVKTSYILMRHNFEELTKIFDVEEIVKVEDMFLKYAEEIQAEKLFRPSPSGLCSYCDHLELCDAGKNKTGTQDFSTGLTDWK